MKKLAAIFISLLIAAPVSAQVISNPTSSARLEAMGVRNEQAIDDRNIFLNPAQISNYKNSVYAEFGTDPCAGTPATLADPLGNSSTVAVGGCGSSITPSPHNDRGAGGTWGGMNMDAGYGTWGVYIGRPYAGVLNVMDVALAGTAPTANKFDLFFGWGTFGAYLSYADLSEEDKDGGTSTTAKDEASEINVGFGGIFMGGTLEAALNLGMPSSKCDDAAAGGAGVGCGVNQFKSDAGTNYALFVRHHGGGGSLLTTVIVEQEDASTKDTSGTGAKTDNTTTSYSLGTALNSRPNADTLIVAGIAITSSSNEIKLSPSGDKTTNDSFLVPVNVGVEHQTLKRLKTRVGLSKNLLATTETKTTTAGVTDSTETSLDGAATLSAGIGWMIGDSLGIDFIINQDILFTGTYVLSGVPETLSSTVAATYRFE